MSDLLGWITKGVSDLIYGEQTGPDGQKLQTSGMLTREQVLQFCDLFIGAVQRPETKERVKAAVGKRPVEEETTDIQREMFVSMGVDGDHGLNCLQSVQSVFRQDKEVLMKFMQMTEMESLACDEAELPAEEFAAKKAAFERGLQMRQTMMAIGSQMQAMMASNPEAAALLQQRAQEHMQRQREAAAAQGAGEVSEDTMFASAAQKMTVAREQMAQMGMDEQAVLQAAFQQLLSANFQAPPTVSLPGHAHQCGGHGHSHAHHGHSHAHHAHSHGDQEGCVEEHPAPVQQVQNHGHSHGGAPCTGHHERTAPSTADKKDM